MGLARAIECREEAIDLIMELRKIYDIDLEEISECSC
jgi:hypothetical protein